MSKFSVPVLVSLVILSGCAHGTMRGTVAMKVSDDEAHVCMGEGEVNAGDQVTLFKNVCPRLTVGKAGSDGADPKSCTKEKVGDGQIERILNEHYSVLKVTSGTKVEEGLIVEKK